MRPLDDTRRRCLLCDPEKKTEWLFQDDLIIVLICEACRCPMAIIRRHALEPTDEELQRIHETAKLLGINKGRWDVKARNVPNHWHVHYRSTPRGRGRSL